MTPEESTPASAAISLFAATRVWLNVALMSFGGPAGQIAMMHRVLVDERKWISERRFLHALNFCMLLPGPEAQQLATYIGWLTHGVAGGLVAGGLFILPGVAAIMALSVIYVVWGGVGFVAGAFLGLKAAVLAIVLQAILRIGGRALKTTASRFVAGAAFVAIFFFNAPFPAIILAAGVIGYFATKRGYDLFARVAHCGDEEDGADEEISRGKIRDAHRAALVFLALWLAPIALLAVALGADHVYTRIALFFSKMAIVTFGGAYAVLSYVAQQAVESFQWMAPAEMLDGLGMAETTPGPLIMVVQFVGFMAAFRHAGALAPLAAGALGGLLATYVTFAPCFLWIFAGAPYVERLRHNKALSGALAAVTAAVVGVILNLAIWFAIHVIFRKTVVVSGYGFSFDAPVLTSVDFWSLALSIGATLAIFQFRVGVLGALAGACLAGVALKLAGAI